jgi:hypothetical protein
MVRPSGAGVVAALALVAASCGRDVAPSDGGVPITPRIVAAIALEYLPAEPSSLGEATAGDDAEGTVGAELRFGAGGEDPGDLVRVSVAPGRTEPLCPDGRCVESAAEDGTLWLTWALVEPEEDPGWVDATLVRDGETVVAHYSGATVTGDPRELQLPVTTDMLRAVVLDSRLRLTTTRDAVDAGEALEEWGASPSVEPTARQVPADARSLAAFWRTSLEWSARTPPVITRVGDSRVVDRLGVASGRVVSSHLVLEPTKDRPATTLDLVVSEKEPALLAEAACPSPAFAGCAVDPRNAPYDIFVLWNPGPRGVVWVLYQRDDAYLTARFAGWEIPGDLDEALADQIDFEALLSTFAYVDFFGFTTTPEFAEMPVP